MIILRGKSLFVSRFCSSSLLVGEPTAPPLKGGLAADQNGNLADCHLRIIFRPILMSAYLRFITEHEDALRYWLDDNVFIKTVVLQTYKALQYGYPFKIPDKSQWNARNYMNVQHILHRAPVVRKQPRWTRELLT